MLNISPGPDNVLFPKLAAHDRHVTNQVQAVVRPGNPPKEAYPKGKHIQEGRFHTPSTLLLHCYQTSSDLESRKKGIARR